MGGREDDFGRILNCWTTSFLPCFLCLEHEIAALNQMSWLMKIASIELRVTSLNRQRSHTHRLLHLLLDDMPVKHYLGKWDLWLGLFVSSSFESLFTFISICYDAFFMFNSLSNTVLSLTAILMMRNAGYCLWNGEKFALSSVCLLYLSYSG